MRVGRDKLSMILEIYPPKHTLPWQPFFLMSELPVQWCGMLGSSTACFKKVSEGSYLLDTNVQWGVIDRTQDTLKIADILRQGLR